MRKYLLAFFRPSLHWFYRFHLKFCTPKYASGVSSVLYNYSHHMNCCLSTLVSQYDGFLMPSSSPKSLSRTYNSIVVTQIELGTMVLMFPLQHLKENLTDVQGQINPPESWEPHCYFVAYDHAKPAKRRHWCQLSDPSICYLHTKRYIEDRQGHETHQRAKILISDLFVPL